ncbi:MAG: protein phosphatase 2C domain-containing protein [Pirellulales bacterium]|nr:protein phosphatase 2C domain-containing protein [Pirellulales bacterium]
MDHESTTWQSGISHAVRSDIGLRRANNQDSYAVALANSEDAWLARGHLFLVADGMGAHAAGELASKLAADVVPQTYRKHAELPAPDAIHLGVQEANSVIHARGQANAEFHGMGTTGSVLLLLPQGALVAHVGDSRVYRLRGQQLEQLTFDHSLAWEMMSSGHLSDEQLPASVPRNIITRSLGPSPQVEIDREGPYPLAVGDTFLLCSDGLSGQVTDDEMGQILVTLDPEEAAQALVDLANLRGGPDNITVIVAKVTSPRLISHADTGWTAAAAESESADYMRLLFWGMSLVALFAAMSFGAARYWAAAGLGATVAAAFAAAAYVTHGGRRALQEHVGGEARYGRGPYRTRHCLPDRRVADELAKIVGQLRQAATDGNFAVDWSRFRGWEEAAVAAAERSDYAIAIRSYCRAMSSMMQQLRNQSSGGTSAGAGAN